MEYLKNPRWRATAAHDGFQSTTTQISCPKQIFFFQKYVDNQNEHPNRHKKQKNTSTRPFPQQFNQNKPELVVVRTASHA